jgi:Mg-chelatase subunit ChlD
MFERPAILFLLCAAPLFAVPGIVAIRRGRRLSGAVEMALRLMCFAILVLMTAGLRITRQIAARRMAMVVEIDQSRSIAPDQLAWMRANVAELSHAMDRRDRLAVLSFGRDARLVTPFAEPRIAGPLASRELARTPRADPGATDIAAAMTAAAGLFPASTEKRLLILSDGVETQGNATDELPAMAEEGIRIYSAAPPPSATRRVALTEFYSPDSVREQQSFAFNLEIESEAPGPVEAHLRLKADGELVGGRTVSLRPGLNRFELPYRIDHAGAYVVGVQLEVPAPMLAVNSHAETAVSVIAAPRVLVISADPPTSLINALELRKYRVEQAPPRGLPERAEAYFPYQAVIVADAGAEAMPEGAQQALNRYVADFGGGLVVTGDALRDDKFKGGALEKALPVLFQPQPPPPSREPIAVYLCIDRSNSMSYNSRYPAVRDGERIRYAKQAAIALLRQLDDSDYVGVIAFDSQPYVLSRLRLLGEDRAELETRIERLEPGGGTDFKDSLEIAEREILDSGIAVRQVILITDGDTNRQYHDHDALIADYAEKHIPVSTIRIGPDLANLRLLEDFAQATGGVFYRVEDIEKLPQLLVRLTRKAMNKESHGQVRLEYGGPSAILSGINPREIPPLEFFATTEAKEAARVPLRIRRGDKSAPLLAAWAYGLGRSVVFTADPDSLASLSWIRWNRYAEFWSQIVNWVARPGESGLFNLRIGDSPGGGHRIVAEKADSTPATSLACRITGAHEAFDVAMTQLGPSVYSGDTGSLGPGKYTATLMRKEGDTEQALLSRQFAVVGATLPDAEELKIRPPNIELLRRLAAETKGSFDAPITEVVKRSGATMTSHASAAPSLIPIAIALVLAEVFVRRRFLGLC